MFDKRDRRGYALTAQSCNVENLASLDSLSAVKASAMLHHGMCTVAPNLCLRHESENACDTVTLKRVTTRQRA
jgi:hypothetical protein